MKTVTMIAVLLLSTATFASSTGTLFLSGTVAAINDLTITPTAGAQNLNITQGEVGKLVATVSEISNSLSDYKILMRSANSSKLVNTINSNKTTTYTISYDGGSYITLGLTDQVVKNLGSLEGLTTNSSDVKVNVAPYGTAPAGTYTDTVTISIAAN